MVERPLLKRSKLDASLKVPLMKLFTYYTKYDFMLLNIGILAAFVNGMCFPVLFFKIGDVMDKIDDYGDDDDEFYNETTEVSYALICLGLIAAATGCIAYICFSWIGSRQGLNFRSMVMNALLTLPMDWYDRHSTSDLTHTVDSNCKDIEQATGEKQLVIFYTISFTLTAIGIAFYSCSQVAFVGMAEVPCYIVGMYLIYKAAVIAITEHGKDYQDAGQLADEAFTNHKFISASNAQGRISEEYRTRLERNKGKYMKIGLLQGLGWGIVWGTWLAFGGIIFWYGSYLAHDYHDDLIFQDQVDEGDIVTVFFVIGLMCLNFGNLMPSIEAIAKGQYAAYNVFSIIGSAEVQREGHRVETIDGKVEFRDVSFSYPMSRDMKVLDKVNFTLSPGHITYLCGNTGSGKTTIANLIVRFYEPTEGAVTLDGINIRALDLQFLRANIALVLKDPMIFNASLHDNIHMGNLEASRERVLEAATRSGVTLIANTLPNGFDTIIQTKGKQLSLGQKQKVALARAYLKNAKIMIIDCGTSALDSESEAQFYNVAQNMKSEKTILFASSRNYPLTQFDHVLKVKGGSVTVIEDSQLDLNTSDSRLTSHDYASLKSEGDSIRVTDISMEKETKDSNEPVQPAADTPEGNIILQTMRIMSKYMLWVGVIILAATIGGSAFPLFGALIGMELHFFIDEDGDNMYSDCREAAIIMIVSSFLLFAAMSVLGLALSKVGTESTLEIRSMTFSKLMNYDEYFYDDQKHTSQRVSYTLSQDADKLQGFGAHLLGLVVLVLAAFVCGSILELVFAWKLGLVIMACAPLLTLADLSSPMLNFFNTKSTSYVESNEIAKEATSNAKIVYAYNLRSRMSTMYMSSVTDNNQDVKRRGVYYGMIYGAGLLTLFVIYALVFWYGAWLVREDGLSFKRMLVATYTCVLTAYGITMSLSFAPNMNAAHRSSSNIFKLSNYKPIINVTEEVGHIRQIQGNFQLNQVSFAYPGQEHLAIVSATFDIPAGSVFGIWGRSGAGKSTICQLLVRLYDPTSGSILVDGVNLRDYNLKVLRSHIAIAFQEPVLFNGTIRDNLTMDGRAREESELIQAAQITNAWEFLGEHPKALERDVGVHGTRLSPGQQQQIALTRAILRHPSVLILDEALSSMKAEDEVEVIRRIRARWPDQTIILISHNKLVNMLAGQVVVLDEGVATKTGQPRDLVDS